MPSPKQPLSLPSEISPHLRALFDKLLVIAKDHRTMQLVDYLDELLREFHLTCAELEALDFPTIPYLADIAEDDLDSGDDRPCAAH